MLENQKINKRQFMIWVILTSTSTSILVVPGPLVARANQDAWIAALLGIIVGLFITTLYNALGNLFENTTIVEYMQKVLGKYFGTLVSLWFVLFLLLDSSAILWVVGNFIAINILPETPIEEINILFLIVVIIGSRLGVEVIVRAAEVLFPWVLTVFIILVLLLGIQVKFQNIHPILENGIKPILSGILTYEVFTTLTSVNFLMFYPVCINDAKGGKKSFLLGTLIGGTIIFTITFLSILVMGATAVKRNVYPSYELVKKIALGNFVERVEALIAMIWIVSIFFKEILCFYGTNLGLAQIFKLKDYKSLTLPVGMIVIVLSLVVYPNDIYEREFEASTWMYYALTSGLFIPTLLLVVGKIKKRVVKR
jgi:spore germination protein KB